MTDEQKVILEQYKIFVELADRTSTKRSQANMFYVSLMSGLIVALSAIIEKKLFVDFSVAVNFTISILGLMVCMLWRRTIISYKALNSAKYKVISLMEAQLPFACFDKEWEILGKGNNKRYRRLTAIETYIPVILSVPFFALLIYSITNFFNFFHPCA